MAMKKFGRKGSGISYCSWIGIYRRLPADESFMHGNPNPFLGTVPAVQLYAYRLTNSKNLATIRPCQLDRFAYLSIIGLYRYRTLYLPYFVQAA